MTREEAIEGIKRISKIVDPMQLEIYINTEYQKLPRSLKLATVDDPIETTVYKVLAQKEDEKKSTESEDTIENINHENVDISKEKSDSTTVEFSEEDLPDILKMVFPDDPEKESKVIEAYIAGEKQSYNNVTLLYYSDEDSPIGLEYYDRIILFGTPSTIPAEALETEIEVSKGRVIVIHKDGSYNILKKKKQVENNESTAKDS